MKKIVALLILALMILAFAACGQKESTNNSETVDENSLAQDESLSGVYTAAESPVITDDIKKLVEKATSELDGAVYTPVAYVSSQVVAGTNHLILCKITPVVLNAAGHYALVTIYENLDGDTEIIEIVESEVEVPIVDEEGKQLMGGIIEPETPDMTDEAKNALEKACAELTNEKYESVALLGTQVVAGTNYTILCKVTPTVPDQESKYLIVTVYSDLSGNAEIIDTFDFKAEA